MSIKDSSIPDAELLLATGCAHCPVVLDALSQLLKEGLVGRLEITNIAVHPERAQTLNVRSVPWTRIGELVFEGLHSPAELRQWAQKAATLEGRADYVREQLKQGQLSKLEQQLTHSPALLAAVIPLLEDEETEMQVRIGLDAILESLTGTEILAGLLPELARLSETDNVRIRGDITHYLGLTRHPDAAPYLEKRLADESEEIREIAEEALEAIRQS